MIEGRGQRAPTRHSASNPRALWRNVHLDAIEELDAGSDLRHVVFEVVGVLDVKHGGLDPQLIQLLDQFREARLARAPGYVVALR